VPGYIQSRLPALGMINWFVAGDSRQAAAGVDFMGGDIMVTRDTGEQSCCEFSSGAFPKREPFGKVLSLNWYDGTTSGLVQCSRCSAVFKYDIVDWDSNQERRIFAFSPINSAEFDHIISLLSASASPSWPFWNPSWRFDSPKEKNRVAFEVDACLSRAALVEYIVAADRMLQTLFGAKNLSDPARNRLPETFDGLPASDDFNYWREYIGLDE